MVWTYSRSEIRRTTVITTVASALRELLDNTTPLAAAVDRHFSPDYRQRTDGKWSDRDEFTAHIAHLRSLVASITVTVLDDLREGRAFAERHVVDIVKIDGGRVVQEVYVFGEFAVDGRFERLEEVTLMLEGAEPDRAMGSAR